MCSNQHNKLFACHLRLFEGGAKNFWGVRTAPAPPPPRKSASPES